MSPFFSLPGRHPRKAGSPAFTLIEMLLVVTIIAILLAFAGPSIFGALRGNRMTGAGESLLGAMSEAQQTAFSQGYPVEVRFYQYTDPSTGVVGFRGYQFFKVSSPDGANTEQITKISETVKLPDGVYISAAPSMSPTLVGGTFADSDANSGVTGASYSAMRFLPDGTCKAVASAAGGIAALQYQTLPNSFFTLVEDTNTAAAALPDNFYIIQTDPFTGKSRSYRPGF
ncbi:Verru_Chthon cassette protein D [Verrucomicrobium spinosum]|nr:Verru_Chthon cassette protein D [Verrucomicrobium spinosum]